MSGEPTRARADAAATRPGRSGRAPFSNCMPSTSSMLGIAAAPSSSTGRDTPFGRSTPVQMTSAAAANPQTAGTRTQPPQRRPAAAAPARGEKRPDVYITRALVTK